MLSAHARSGTSRRDRRAAGNRHQCLYKGILLKLSGEALMGGRWNGIDPETIARIADEIVDVHRAEVEIAIVTGEG